MADSLFQQGQSLQAIGTPDYYAEGALPFSVGLYQCRAITVSQLRGPMGFYDVAVIEFDNDNPPIVVPLHLCDHIQT